MHIRFVLYARVRYIQKRFLDEILTFVRIVSDKGDLIMTIEEAAYNATVTTFCFFFGLVLAGVSFAYLTKMFEDRKIGISYSGIVYVVLIALIIAGAIILIYGITSLPW